MALTAKLSKGTLHAACRLQWGMLGAHRSSRVFHQRKLLVGADQCALDHVAAEGEELPDLRQEHNRPGATSATPLNSWPMHARGRACSGGSQVHAAAAQHAWGTPSRQAAHLVRADNGVEVADQQVAVELLGRELHPRRMRLRPLQVSTRHNSPVSLRSAQHAGQGISTHAWGPQARQTHMWGGRGSRTSTEGGCMESAVLAVFSMAASSAEEVSALAVACAALTGALSAGAGGSTVGSAAGGFAASGGLKKTGKGDPPIGDPFTSTLS